jgi:hypothetical protein
MLNSAKEILAREGDAKRSARKREVGKRHELREAWNQLRRKCHTLFSLSKGELQTLWDSKEQHTVNATSLHIPLVMRHRVCAIQP